MKEIIEEVNRCLGCKNKPCSIQGCPLNNDIPNFIEQVKKENYKQAYEILCETTVLSSICGRICPHMKQCQGKCIRGIKSEPLSIGEIEAFVGDMAIRENWKIKDNIIKNNKKVAVIGSGPSSLTCAAFLAKEGFNVVIFEKFDTLGGILRRGIPNFRLEKNILDNTINKILNLGIEVKTNVEFSKDIKLEMLKKEYDAIFIGIGANKSSKMRVQGEYLEQVLGGNELLELNNHPNYKDKIVAVNGGGNVAMDCARTIKRLGAKKVYVIYRRSEEQMPAEKKEIEEAKIENIEFLFQNNIIKMIPNNEGKLEKIELIKTKLVEKEGEERLVPVNIEGSNYEIKVDYLISAIGSKPDKEILESLDLELDDWGYIKVDNKYRTTDEKVYAGGDIIGQKATVAWAAKAGREAAKTIINDLK